MTRPRLCSPLALAALTIAAGACASSPPAPLAGPSPGRSEAVVSGDAGAERVDLSGRPFLGTLLGLALERNPRIHAARARAEAAAETAHVDGWLPDPRVVVGWYETPVETRVGAQRWSVGLTQPIPFPTRLSRRAEAADAGARRSVVAYERTTRDVLVEVVSTAHELAYIDAAARISGEVAAVLDRYVAAAEADDAGLIAELFRAETQRAQLDSDRILLAELRAAEEQRLLSLLALDPGTAIGSPALGPVPSVDATFADLVAVAEQHSQELREAGLAQEEAQARAELEQTRGLPDLSAGVTRIGTDRLDHSLGMDPDGNGDDPVIVQLGATLPIWVARDRAAVRRARALQRAAALDRAGAVQDLRDRLARAWFRVGNAGRLLRLYRDTLVPRAAAAARTAEDLLAAGKGSYGGLLETVAVWHNFRLAEARARADHGQAVAELERVIGRPFGAQPDAEGER